MLYVKNVPTLERIVRIVLGVVATALSLTFLKGILSIAFALSAIGIVISGLIGFCPACAMVGRRLDKQIKP
ncbi:YgaP family membrane protein [Burkholderia sp. PU8-34]